MDINATKNLKDILLKYMFDHAGNNMDYYNIYKQGYSIKEIAVTLARLGHRKEELLFFHNTLFSCASEDHKKMPWFRELCDVLIGQIYKSSEKDAIVIDAGQYGILRISPHIKVYQENLKIIDVNNDFRKFGLLTALETVQVRDVSPQFLEVINTLPNLKNLDISLEDGITNQKWPAITNKTIRELKLDGWQGKYNGITLPRHLISLTLYRRLAHFINLGLPELISLKKIEARSCLGIVMQPILNHPSIEQAYLTGGKDSRIFIPSNSKIKKLSIDNSVIQYCILASDQLEELKISSKKNLNIECKRKSYRLKTVFVEAKFITDISFLEFMPEIEELCLDGLEEFDCHYLLNFKKIKKLTLRNIKLLRNVDILNMLKNLTYFDGGSIKKIDGKANNLNIHLNTLRITNVHPKILKNFLTGSTCKIFIGHFIKNIDFSLFCDPAKLEELYILHSNTRQSEILKNASNIKILSLDLKQEISLKFLVSMTYLKKLRIQAYPAQKKFILQYCQSLKNCQIEFANYTEH